MVALLPVVVRGFCCAFYWDFSASFLSSVNRTGSIIQLFRFVTNDPLVTGTKADRLTTDTRYATITKVIKQKIIQKRARIPETIPSVYLPPHLLMDPISSKMFPKCCQKCHPQLSAEVESGFSLAQSLVPHSLPQFLENPPYSSLLPYFFRRDHDRVPPA